MKLGWPQIVYICLIMMNLGMYLVKHGEKNNTKYNFFTCLLSNLISVWILYSGGFFS